MLSAIMGAGGRDLDSLPSYLHETSLVEMAQGACRPQGRLQEGRWTVTLAPALVFEPPGS